MTRLCQEAWSEPGQARARQQSCCTVGRNVTCLFIPGAGREGGGEMVAALYVDSKRGPYASMPGVDAWDEARDARTYPGTLPVVAHPPCCHWCKLRWNCRKPEEWRGMAPLGVEQVRTWGGVLEHPDGSALWAHSGLPSHRGGVDAHGGYTLSVDQVGWGHPCRKRTWLYVVGVGRDRAVEILESHRIPGAKPTHMMGVPAHKGRTLPCLPKTQRHLTPVPLARALVEIASEVC